MSNNLSIFLLIKSATKNLITKRDHDGCHNGRNLAFTYLIILWYQRVRKSLIEDVERKKYRYKQLVFCHIVRVSFPMSLCVSDTQKKALNLRK